MNILNYTIIQLKLNLSLQDLKILISLKILIEILKRTAIVYLFIYLNVQDTQYLKHCTVGKYLIKGF